MANPQHYVLVADTEKIFTLDKNYGEVRVTVLADPALIFLNTKDVTIASVATGVTGQDGNVVLPAELCSRVLRDQTSGAVSKVRVRSLGTATVSVEGIE